MSNVLNPITDEKTGKFTFTKVCNMGEAWEICEDLFNYIKRLEATFECLKEANAELSKMVKRDIEYISRGTPLNPGIGDDEI